jgi:tripartite-type tricarboxylate transporter receptor subunit TctC
MISILGVGSRPAVWLLFATATAATCAPAHAQAGDYPDKPIRVVVTFPPGGSTDAVVRLLAPRLGERLGQQIVVDNRPGAGGNIGLAVVAQAPADGYTIGVGAAGGLSVNVSLYAKMPFDPVKDLKPVAMLAAIPFVIIGQRGLPARTQKELIAYAKANPGKVSIAHGGNGTAMHLSAALFNQMGGAGMIEVPFKGSGPAALAVLAGQVSLAVVDLPSALAQIEAGKVVAYAVTSPQRLRSLPDVPTVDEAGLPGYDSTGWFGIIAPAATPAAIVGRLHDEINAALNDEAIKASIRKLGVEPAPETREAFEAYIRSETQKWARVIKTADVKLD